MAKKRGRKVETRDSFTLLGGTAQAAKLLGRGSYRVPMRTDRDRRLSRQGAGREGRQGLARCVQGAQEPPSLDAAEAAAIMGSDGK